MDYIAMLVLFSIIGTFFMNIYYQARNKQTQMESHLMNAKNFIDNPNFHDDREWFVQRFQEAQTHLVQAQVICSREIDSRTIHNLWEQIGRINRGRFISN